MVEVILHFVQEDVPLGVIVSYPGHYIAHRDHMTFYICPQHLLYPVLLYMWYDFLEGRFKFFIAEAL